MPAILEPTPRISHQLRPPVEVRARTFGAFSVEIDGRAVGERDWKAANARWLFLYLLLHEGEEIPQERLRELFWPASPPGKGHRALLTSVYRARQALGHPDLIQRVEGAYRLGGGCQLWLDVREFLRCHRQASSSPEQRAGLLQRMRELYRGPFVPECTDIWCAVIRSELEQLRLQIL